MRLFHGLHTYTRTRCFSHAAESSALRRMGMMNHGATHAQQQRAEVRHFSSSTPPDASEQQKPVTPEDIKTQRKVLFPRAEEEDGVDRDVEDPEEGVMDEGEYGFKYKGKDPTRFGDWAHKGRVTDF